MAPVSLCQVTVIAPEHPRGPAAVRMCVGNGPERGCSAECRELCKVRVGFLSCMQHCGCVS